MKVAFIARSTLFKSKGGDTCQVLETARHLRNLGVSVEIFPAHAVVDYNSFDIIHLFNLTRPADILSHIQKAHKPCIISPIWIDYSEYDRKHRTGIAGTFFQLWSPDQIAYLKTVARWILKKDSLASIAYLWMGQKKSIRYILSRIAQLLPNSALEQQQMQYSFSILPPARQVPNGVDPELFSGPGTNTKDKGIILCVARIEGIKNQLNLIKALNNTQFKLLLIGASAPNQPSYYKKCRQLAASNIAFINHLPQKELVYYYQKAKVHVLPSWFETCGLSSLEAAVMGCNVVITDKGYSREYFEDDAFYCDPGSPESIRQAIEKAANAPFPHQLSNKILHNYTWQKAAEATLSAYKAVLHKV